MNKILNYLNAAYDPEAIIVYGSLADGTNNADSDFDCRIISTRQNRKSRCRGVLPVAWLFYDSSVPGGTARLQGHPKSVLLIP